MIVSMIKDEKIKLTVNIRTNDKLISIKEEEEANMPTRVNMHRLMASVKQGREKNRQCLQLRA